MTTSPPATPRSAGSTGRRRAVALLAIVSALTMAVAGAVLTSGGVGHDVERQAGPVLEQGFAVGVKPTTLTYPGHRELIEAGGEGPQVQGADRAAGVAAELQVHHLVRVRNPHRPGLKSWQFLYGDDVTHPVSAHLPIIFRPGQPTRSAR